MPFHQPPGKRKLFSKAKPKLKEDPDQKKKALQQKKKQLKKEQKKLEQELKALEPKEEKPQKRSITDLMESLPKPLFSTLAPILPEASLVFDLLNNEFKLEDKTGEPWSAYPGKVELTHQPIAPVEHISLNAKLASQSRFKKFLWQVTKVSDTREQPSGQLSKSEHIYAAPFVHQDHQIDLERLQQQIKESSIKSVLVNAEVSLQSGNQKCTLIFSPALSPQEINLLDSFLKEHKPPPAEKEFVDSWDQYLIKAQQEMQAKEEQKKASQELKPNKNFDIFPKKLPMRLSDKKEN